eukprot:TRINITY_DN851_c0_g3_i2.p1 TRINITY_DN851_c0_g3~~TRINITY_DN851_c0_g3_i2.p1  ORF type:complete len:664 (+),score=145.38 TRINITY_DN851_c0_g3_i2:91-2082(+)
MHKLVLNLGTSYGIKEKRSLKKYAVSFLGIDEVLQINEEIGCLFCMEYSPNGSYLATAGACYVQIWDMNEKKCIYNIQDHAEIATAFKWFNTDITGNKSMFVSGSLDKTLRLYKDYKCVKVMNEHKDWIRCLGLSFDNSTLVSGCVSSGIVGWDTECARPLWRVDKAHSFPTGNELDTINSLEFSYTDNHMFASGARDGFLKIWDVRDMKSPSMVIRTHMGKLNSIVFSPSDDLYILTAGRDDTVRLWDMRKLSSTEYQPGIGNSSSSIIMEYKQHKCSGYNISAHFFNEGANVVTGSEDGKIYIYDTLTGKIDANLTCPYPNYVIHLVQPSPTSVEILSSSIEDINITVWRPLGSEPSPLPSNVSTNNSNTHSIPSPILRNAANATPAAFRLSPSTQSTGDTRTNHTNQPGNRPVTITVSISQPRTPQTTTSTTTTSTPTTTTSTTTTSTTPSTNSRSSSTSHNAVNSVSDLIRIEDEVSEDDNPDNGGDDDDDEDDDDDDDGMFPSGLDEGLLTSMEEDVFLAIQRIAVESLMKRFGDKILALFHKYNVTFSTLDWGNLLTSIENNEDRMEFLNIINHMSKDFERALAYCATRPNDLASLPSYLASFEEEDKKKESSTSSTSSSTTNSSSGSSHETTTKSPTVGEHIESKGNTLVIFAKKE